jgi:hypothetical protein
VYFKTRIGLSKRAWALCHWYMIQWDHLTKLTSTQAHSVSLSLGTASLPSWSVQKILLSPSLASREGEEVSRRIWLPGSPSLKTVSCHFPRKLNLLPRPTAAISSRKDDKRRDRHWRVGGRKKKTEKRSKLFPLASHLQRKESAVNCILTCETEGDGKGRDSSSIPLPMLSLLRRGGNFLFWTSSLVFGFMGRECLFLSLIEDVLITRE